MEHSDTSEIDTSKDRTGELDRAWPVDLQSLSLSTLTRDLIGLGARVAPWPGRTIRG
jgi:hypothetical protein